MRLIDADALIEFCAERWIPLNIDAVNMQPTIESEIIRYKDCRFNDGTAYCVFHFRYVKGEDYCSWGERRTE